MSVDSEPRAPLEERFMQDIARERPEQAWGAADERWAEAALARAQEEAKGSRARANYEETGVRAQAWASLAGSLLSLLWSLIFLVSDTGSQWRLAGYAADTWPKFFLAGGMILFSLTSLASQSVTLCGQGLPRLLREASRAESLEQVARMLKVELAKGRYHRRPVSDFRVEAVQTLDALAPGLTRSLPAPEPEAAPEVVVEARDAPEAPARPATPRRSSSAGRPVRRMSLGADEEMRRRVEEAVLASMSKQ